LGLRAQGENENAFSFSRKGNPVQRTTRQREAIRRAVRHAGRPLAPNEILEAARADVPQLGLATVYRAIAGLVEAGWLATVEIPGEPPRYERANLPHHHHFRCRACGRVFDLAPCGEHFDRLAPPGFTVEHHEVILWGVCLECGEGR